MTMATKNDLRDRVAADIFVNSVADLKHEYIFNQVKEASELEGKEMGTYLAEQAIRMADGFIEVLLNKEKEKRVCG